MVVFGCLFWVEYVGGYVGGFGEVVLGCLVGDFFIIVGEIE